MKFAQKTKISCELGPVLNLKSNGSLSLTVYRLIDSESHGNDGCNYGSAVSQAGSLVKRAHADVLCGVHLLLGRVGVERPKLVAFIFVEALIVTV